MRTDITFSMVLSVTEDLEFVFRRRLNYVTVLFVLNR